MLYVSNLDMIRVDQGKSMGRFPPNFFLLSGQINGGGNNDRLINFDKLHI